MRPVAEKESALEALFNREVKAAGGRPGKWSAAGERANPDRITLWPEGVAAFAELKREGKEPTKAQQDRLDDFAALGFIAMAIDTPMGVARFLAAVKAEIARRRAAR